MSDSHFKCDSFKESEAACSSSCLAVRTEATTEMYEYYCNAQDDIGQIEPYQVKH